MLRRFFSVLALASIALLTTSSAALADVNDFEIARWDQQISLDLDEEGRATARIVETVVADFPDYDQNRGVVRLLLREYANAQIGPSDLSVVDENGTPVPFETESDGNAFLVLTGDDSYLRGPHTFVLSYTYRDIVQTPDDADIDEWYWDLLPIDRAQPILDFTATVIFAPSLASRLTGNTDCAEGPAGAQAMCQLEGPIATADGDAKFTVASSLAAYSGVSIAIGLEPGTVVQPGSRAPNAFTDLVPIGIAVGALGFAGAAGVMTTRMRRKAREATGLVIAQYDVPDSLPPILVPSIVEGTKSSIPAEFIHLAVRGAIQIEDGAKPKQPIFRLVDAAQAPDLLDAQAIKKIFGSGAQAGTKLPLPKSDAKFSSRMTALSVNAQKASQSRGLMESRRSAGALRLSLVAVGVALIGTAIPAFAQFSGRLSASLALTVAVIGLALTVAIAISQFVKRPIHTPSGAEAREYLLGVREFIRVAEADRLKMLQSYTGAERTELDGAQVVQIYERLLPYAMLFGLEKEWGKVLQLAYEREHTSPLWYPGMVGGISSLDRSLSSFSRSVGSSAAYSASSSSGSSGGAVSGGGGGGGGFGGR
jgi:uncharacterized membrane protein YgcG